jgi:zinc/manganese transport system substrate-binding protein
MLGLALGLLVCGAITAFDAAFARAIQIPVVTTTPDLKALTEAVGGDRVGVESLLGGDQDPHQLEVKPGQIARLREAMLLIKIGLDHEPWLPRLLQLAENDRILPRSPGHVDASRGISLLETALPRAGGGGHVHAFGNTHYWLDPANAAPITERILKALQQLSPEDTAAFEANRQRFLDRLMPALEQWLKAMEPYRGTRVVAFHDSWAYFAKRVGLTVAALIEPKPGIPASPSYLASLIGRMKEHQVKIIVLEPYADEATARFVAERSRATLVRLAPSVGSDEGACGYIELFEHNIHRLIQAFQDAGLPRQP